MPSPADPSPITDGPFAAARLRHAALRVPDMEASKRWFSEKLDFRVLCEWTMGENRCAWLGLPGDDSFHIEIIGGNSPEPNPEFGSLEETLEYSGYHHVCIDVPSVEAALGELRRRGVTVVGEPVDVLPLGRRVAFVADPWGNLVEIAERIA